MDLLYGMTDNRIYVQSKDLALDRMAWNQELKVGHGHAGNSKTKERHEIPANLCRYVPT